MLAKILKAPLIFHAARSCLPGLMSSSRPPAAIKRAPCPLVQKRFLGKPQEHKGRDGKIIKDSYDGDYSGQINAYLRWDGVADEKDRYEITVFLIGGNRGAPKDECSVDMTPRRCQNFKCKPGEKFQWSSTPAGLSEIGAPKGRPIGA